MNIRSLLKKTVLILAVLPLLSLANLYTSNSLVAERFERGGGQFHNQGYHYNSQRGYNNQYHNNSYQHGYENGAVNGYERGENNNNNNGYQGPTYVIPFEDPGSYQNLNPQQQ